MTIDTETAIEYISEASTKLVGLDTYDEFVEISSGTYRRARTKGAVTADQIFLSSNVSGSQDAYTLARMIATEVGKRASPEYMLAVGEVVRNQARATGRSVHDLLLRSPRFPETRFWYGEQRGRYASTLLDPNQKCMMAARLVLGGSRMLTTRARKFFDPATQARGIQGGRRIRPPEDVINRWAEEGWEWIGPVAGINPFRLMIFHKSHTRPVDTAAALDVIKRGRRKYNLLLATIVFGGIYGLQKL